MTRKNSGLQGEVQGEKTRKDHHGCPVQATVNLISGKWKVQILWHLSFRPRRLAEIRKKLKNHFSRKGAHRAIASARKRTVLCWVAQPLLSPPQVTYSLDDPGEELVPTLQTLCDWGCAHLHMKPSLPRHPKVGLARLNVHKSRSFASALKGWPLESGRYNCGSPRIANCPYACTMCYFLDDRTRGLPLTSRKNSRSISFQHQGGPCMEPLATLFTIFGVIFLFARPRRGARLLLHGCRLPKSPSSSASANSRASPGLASTGKTPFIRKCCPARMSIEGSASSTCRWKPRRKNNVFVQIPVSIQYKVLPEGVESAFYKLSDPVKQIESMVYTSSSGTVPQNEARRHFPQPGRHRQRPPRLPR